MSIVKDLNENMKKIVEKAGYQEENVILQPSGRRDLGQFQLNDAMNLAKTYKKNPRIIAQDIVKVLEEDGRFTNLNIAGPGFINITLTDEYLGELLTKIYEDKSLNIDKRPNKKVVLDYGGANVAKALHVGHLRSANIGEALKRLAKALGYEVIGDAHLGDYGRPLGLVVLEIKKRYPNLAYFDTSYKGDYSEIKLPITNKDLEEIYPFASNKSKEDEEYLEEARDITYKIQNHERGYYDLWKKVVEISKNDIKQVYDKLNVNFELWLGESDAAEYIDELTEIYEQQNALTESEGAQVVEVKEETDKSPMPPLLFKRSNGTISYETTDLATILQRKKDTYDIIDGQQRLVTLSLFLSELHIKGISLLQQQYQSLLAEKYIAYNKFFIGNLLTAVRRNNRRNFAERIWNRIEFNVLILNDSSIDLAYTFFSNENSRGKELSDFDLLKAHHLRFVTDNQEQSMHLAKKWDKMILRAEDTHNDLYAAIDLVSEKLERQIRKNKTRMKKNVSKDLIDFNTNFKVEKDENEKGRILRRKLIETKPMNEEEAILQMNLLGHDFFVFTNEATNQINILYRRKDMNYGLIETR